MSLIERVRRMEWAASQEDAGPEGRGLPRDDSRTGPTARLRPQTRQRPPPSSRFIAATPRCASRRSSTATTSTTHRDLSAEPITTGCPADEADARACASKRRAVMEQRPVRDTLSLTFEGSRRSFRIAVFPEKEKSAAARDHGRGYGILDVDALLRRWTCRWRRAMSRRCHASASCAWTTRPARFWGRCATCTSAVPSGASCGS